ncbi:signal peptidase I [Rhodococcus sp. SGAir0479]|uniref:signal peptidase I n=1 Tax=Rhodococcus sp. SGAir0479 TaxID=2567884 RepID=UPI001586EB4A|nr:signal peptidase I [Rhodococcus sp. SGAir0479]
MSNSAPLGDQRTTAWWWVRSIVSWTLLIAMIAVLAMTIAVPRITGSTPYTVLTGSMEPTYPPGTLVVVKSADPASLGPGDAVTYQWESGKTAVVTHRITEVEYAEDGELQFVTQGDANPMPDERPVVPEQIRGKVWYAIPYLGYVNNFVTGKQRSILLIALVGGLLAYAAYMFASAARDEFRNRRNRETDTEDPVTDELPVVAAGSSIMPN